MISSLLNLSFEYLLGSWSVGNFPSIIVKVVCLIIFILPTLCEKTLTQVRFRLTRMGTCPHVTDLLLDATGPLQLLHTRVLEAGCEVNPSWKLGCPSWGVQLGAGGPVGLYMQLACWTFSRGKVYQPKLTNWHSFGYSSLMKYISAFPCNEFVVFFEVPSPTVSIKKV